MDGEGRVVRGGGAGVFDPPSRNNQQSPGALNVCAYMCVCVSVYVRCGVFWLHAKTSSYQEIDQRLRSLFLSVSICLSCSYFSQSFLPRPCSVP